jgi:WD40 repeat protein
MLQSQPQIVSTSSTPKINENNNKQKAYLASASCDKKIKIWNLETAKCSMTLEATQILYISKILSVCSVLLNQCCLKFNFMWIFPQ